MKPKIACLAGLLIAAPIYGQFKVGTAKIDITPTDAIWMSGYANRSKPSEGVAQKLWARAVAVDDGRGKRVVLLGADLIGFPRQLTDVVAARLGKEHGLERADIVVNASHTHSGPMVWPNLRLISPVPAAEEARLKEYAGRVTEALVEAGNRALGGLKPARLEIAHGKVTFGVNRRVVGPGGVKFGVSPQAPKDEDVPVMRALSPDGKLLAVFFGYACHNTTLTGDNYQIHGDYSGVASEELEKAAPDAVALFYTLCAGDQNPEPRNTMELAVQHGRTLAAEVQRVMVGGLRPVKGRLRSAFEVIELRFAVKDRADFEKEAQDQNAWRVRRAKEMLRLMDEGRPLRQIPYPVQAVRFGDTFTLVALGGEVVVDYALRVKRERPGQDIVLAAYSNDVMCYIPSLRVLKEGGYEADFNLIYYGMPGPFAEDVEERVMAGVGSVLKRVGR
ncbi:MAG: neutral/alkaline non-lysosomal ceramidase N-terminal domain-containing protein [Bryobacteraceae bacterium]|nr:neutral/alkaline non-lysosomal ceramidase N-terminal domain-containing protein [Bryobacteraceae bacterium]